MATHLPRNDRVKVRLVRRRMPPPPSPEKRIYQSLVEIMEDNDSFVKSFTPKLNKYIPHTPTAKQSAFLLLDCLDAFFGGSCGGGKAMPLNTLILTPFGFKPLRSMKVGDSVSNPDGSVSKIIYMTPIEKLDAYEIEFNDGSKSVCNGNHLWRVLKSFEEEETIDTTFNLYHYKLRNEDNEVYVPATEEVVFFEKYAEPDPFPNLYELGRNLAKNGDRIDKRYKYGSIWERYDVIQGIMDVLGMAEDNSLFAEFPNKKIAKDSSFILRSLGAIVVPEKDKKLKFRIFHRNPDKLFKRYENVWKENAYPKDVYKTVVRIKNTRKEMEMRCITVSNPNGLYIVGKKFTVTHNSDSLLMAALQYVDQPNYNAIIFRDSFANLSLPEGLMMRSQEWLYGTDAKWSADKKRWTFPSGATLSFGFLDGPLDHFHHQSAAYQFVGIDEAVQIRENQALYLFSRMRRLKKHGNVPIRFRCASNPPAADQLERGSWVKRRYIDPKTKKPGAVFIPAKLADNPYLDAEEYIHSMAQLDKITRAQLLEGDWEIQAKGEMFDRSWFEIVQKAPQEGVVIRAWDLSASEEKRSAYNAGVRIRRTPDGIFWIENVVRFRGTPGTVERKIREIAEADGMEVTVALPQDPGQAGKAQIHNYYRVLAGFKIKSSQESGSKAERAMAFSSQAEIGNVKIVRGYWNDDYIYEASVFPNGEYCDQIDASSRAFHDLVRATPQVLTGFSPIEVKDHEIKIDKTTERKEINISEYPDRVGSSSRTILEAVPYF